MSVVEQRGDPTSFEAVIVTVSSTRGDDPELPDRSGPALQEALGALGARVVGRELVADDRQAIAATLREACERDVALVATTGGTGFAVDDVTPEATRDVIEREAPGMAEAMRAVSRELVSTWWLSRATAGTRGRTLIVNFPGSPRAAGECVGAIAAGLPHAIALLRGAPTHHH